LFFSCGNSEKQENASFTEGQQVAIDYATGFSIEEFENYSILTLHSPWPEADALTYLLFEPEAGIPENISYDQKIKIPVQTLVVTSTTHIPALEALNEESKLIGFPGLNYISSEKTRTRIDAGEIKELGRNENINTESLIELQPDVVIGFAIDGNNKTFENIQKTGIPVVYNADWIEDDPLGKAEWIKFIGAFFGKISEATSIFENIEAEYLQAKSLALTAENKPSVIGGSMYRDQWFMPAGNSWQAKFFEDANANYLYKETTAEGSLNLSFEKVLEKSKDADFWISSGHFTSYSQLLDESQHYSQFKAVKNRNVYSPSLSKGATGGVTYFELAPQRPDLVLKDLISIFHPDLLQDYEPVFFKNLKP
jgi:iron complex transport system substrate-binding protein